MFSQIARAFFKYFSSFCSFKENSSKKPFYQQNSRRYGKLSVLPSRRRESLFSFTYSPIRFCFTSSNSCSISSVGGGVSRLTTTMHTRLTANPTARE